MKSSQSQAQFPTWEQLSRRSGGASGFVLLEALFAIAIFGIVAVSLTSALNLVGEAATRARDDNTIIRLIEGELTFRSKAPRIQEGEFEVEPEGTGVLLRTIIEPIEDLENMEGALVPEMFRITTTAFWIDTSDIEQEVSAETWRYARLYR